MSGPKPSHVPLKTTNYSWKLDCGIQTRHSQHRQQAEGQENLEWERAVGSLMSATIELDFDSETDMTVAMRCPTGVQLVSSFFTSLALRG